MLHHQRNNPIATLVFCVCAVAATSISPILRAQDEGTVLLAKSEKGPTKTENQSIAAWTTDLVAFNKHLETLAAMARTPSKQEFEARFKKARKGELKVITDGAGGVVDLKPAEDTVQFRVNEAVKGKTVSWEFELEGDASYYSQVSLGPRVCPTT